MVDLVEMVDLVDPPVHATSPPPPWEELLAGNCNASKPKPPFGCFHSTTRLPLALTLPLKSSPAFCAAQRIDAASILRSLSTAARRVTESTPSLRDTGVHLKSHGMSGHSSTGPLQKILARTWLQPGAR